MKRGEQPMTPSRIKAIRDGLCYTQAEFGQAIGSDIRTVQRWERGDRSPRGPAVMVLLELERRAAEKAATRAAILGRRAE